ncbi:MAG: hypothetical protein COA58_13485 [Bacteroidetes bacterium]|nr:MAG: hypothetical protein COA58_13485 [Bacteroidota bacterium]
MTTNLGLLNFYRALIIVTLFMSVNSNGQNIQSSGTDFWFGYMESLTPSFNGPPKFSLQLSSTASTDVTIEVPGRGYEHTMTLSSNEVVNFDFPGFDLEPRGSGVITNLAVFISSVESIEVVAIHHRQYFSSSTRLFPVHSLGKEYMVLGARDDAQRSPSSLVIVAGLDSTFVNICLTPCGSKGSINVTLNKGQTYQLQSLDDVSGTKITTNKPVSVFSGARQAVLNKADDSHIYFAMPTLDLADTFYAAVPNLELNDFSYIVILGTKNNTSVTVNDDEYLLQDGESKHIKIDGPRIIESSKPIFVGQYNSGSDNWLIRAGPSMTVLNPVCSGLKSVKFITKEDFSGSMLEHAYTIITRDTLDVYFDSIKVVGFSKFPAIQLFYKVAGIENGPHEISSSTGFSGHVYGRSEAEYYTFSFGFSADCLSTDYRVHDTAQKDKDWDIFPNLTKPEKVVYDTVQKGKVQSIKKDTKSFYSINQEECDKWQISPNPNNGIFGIKINGSNVKLDNIEIYDARSRLVYASEWNDNQFEYLNTDLAAGMYYLRISPCDVAKKFVVIKE